MSKVVKNNEENLNKEVISVEEIPEVETVTKKKFKVSDGAKKALKIAGIVGIGILGFMLGARSKSRKGNNEDYEEVESYEVTEDKDENVEE